MIRRTCIFKDPVLRSLVNPRIQNAWTQEGRKGYPPYGAYTKKWREEHCSQLDPYATDHCPYRREDCAIAYMKTAIDSIEHHPDNVVAYFGQLAKWRGAERADNKPSAREYSGTDGHKDRVGDLRGGSASRPLDGLDAPRSEVDQLRRMDDDYLGVRRTAHRFFSAGELLGRTDLRPHLGARRGDEGEAATDDDGDGELSLREPSPVDPVGNQPPAGDQNLHQGGK